MCLPHIYIVSLIFLSHVPLMYIYEALQDIVYKQLPHGINFGISLKRSEITEMGFFGFSLTQKVKILQKKLSVEHYASHLTHHTSHIT